MSRRIENHEILERGSGELNFLNYFDLPSLSELWRYHRGDNKCSQNLNDITLGFLAVFCCFYLFKLYYNPS